VIWRQENGRSVRNQSVLFSYYTVKDTALLKGKTKKINAKLEGGNEGNSGKTESFFL
jgi:hypothetical protein